jgi:hypothetical protein
MVDLMDSMDYMNKRINRSRPSMTSMTSMTSMLSMAVQQKATAHPEKPALAKKTCPCSSLLHPQESGIDGDDHRACRHEHRPHRRTEQYTV